MSAVRLCIGRGLLVRQAGRAAAGVYQCFVSNAAGTDSAAATVLVSTDQLASDSVSASAREQQQHSPPHGHDRQPQSDVQNIAPDSTYLHAVFVACSLIY